MLAVDTNIVVRYLTADHPEQFAKASALIRGEDIYVCTTVLLETEWVLRRGLPVQPRSNHCWSNRLCGTTARHIGEPLIAKALAWMRAGLDFVDALHLAKAGGGEAFVSFDQRFAAVANALSEVKVRGLSRSP